MRPGEGIPINDMGEADQLIRESQRQHEIRMALLGVAGQLRAQWNYSPEECVKQAFEILKEVKKLEI